MHAHTCFLSPETRHFARFHRLQSAFQDGQLQHPHPPLRPSTPPTAGQVLGGGACTTVTQPGQGPPASYQKCHGL